jgi:hypothetical protein
VTNADEFHRVARLIQDPCALAVKQAYRAIRTYDAFFELERDTIAQRLLDRRSSVLPILLVYTIEVALKRLRKFLATKAEDSTQLVGAADRIFLDVPLVTAQPRDALGEAKLRFARAQGPRRAVLGDGDRGRVG